MRSDIVRLEQAEVVEIVLAIAIQIAQIVGLRETQTRHVFQMMGVKDCPIGGIQHTVEV